MKHLIKKYNKIVLFAGVLLFSCDVFSASEATKRMIHDTLSKFCIPPKKENCNPREEGQYDPNYNFCLCEDDGMVYSKSGRKCVECGKGTYYKRNMKDNSCKSCSPGTYQDEIGKSSCKSCYPGSYSSGYGNTGCSSCWAGSFQASSGQSTCLSCNSNNCETSGIGATSCYSRCSGNYVCNGSGSCVCGLTESDCSCGVSASCSCISPRTNCPCGSSDGCTCDAPDECGENEVRSGRCGCKPKPEPEPEPEDCWITCPDVYAEDNGDCFSACLDRGGKG